MNEIPEWVLWVVGCFIGSLLIAVICWFIVLGIMMHNAFKKW